MCSRQASCTSRLGSGLHEDHEDQFNIRLKLMILSPLLSRFHFPGSLWHMDLAIHQILMKFHTWNRHGPLADPHSTLDGLLEKAQWWFTGNLPSYSYSNSKMMIKSWLFDSFDTIYWLPTQSAPVEILWRQCAAFELEKPSLARVSAICEHFQSELRHSCDKPCKASCKAGWTSQPSKDYLSWTFGFKYWWCLVLTNILFCFACTWLRLIEAIFLVPTVPTLN